MSSFVLTASYESRLFLARRLVGVPGYQLDVDRSKEVLSRMIFSVDEIKMLNRQLRATRRHVVFENELSLHNINENSKLIAETNDAAVDDEKKSFSKLSKLSRTEITQTNDDNFQMFLSEKRFYKLSKREQRLVRIEIFHSKAYSLRFVRPLYEIFAGFVIFLMIMYRKYNKMMARENFRTNNFVKN